tara:strand:- start:62 stop:535 length:474 start_codon:yes stop_codon:yes gene_type:complete
MSKKEQKTPSFKELQKAWYKILDESGFDDIERSGKNRQRFFDEYSGILKRPTSVIRAKYDLFTEKYYNIASFLSQNATFLPKIDLKVLELHGKGYTTQRISDYLREHFEYPLNKKGRKGKPYSIFFVHTKLKYLKLLILIYAKTDSLESVKISWQSL